MSALYVLGCFALCCVGFAVSDRAEAYLRARLATDRRLSVLRRG